MTRNFNRFFVAIVCLAASSPTVVAHAADPEYPTTAAKTIWDPRVVPVSATDETPGGDADSEPRWSEPRLQNPRGLSPPSDDSLSGSYPKSSAKPSAMPQAATANNPPAPQQASQSYNRAANAATSRTPRATPRSTPGVTVHQAGALAQLPAEPQSVTAPQAMPGPQPTHGEQAMPGYEGMSEQQAEPPFGSVEFDWGLHKPCESCSGDPSCGESECCPWYRTIKWCAGADYLLTNVRLSNQVAFREQSAVTTPALSTDTSTGVKYDLDDNSNFHVFAGYHTNCGDEIRFGYWHIQSDDSVSGTASGNFAEGVGTGTEFTGPGIGVTVAGDTLTATSHVLLNMYDADHLHRIEWPGCDSCNCPTTDIEWLYGVRVAQFHRSVDAFAPAENGATGEQSASGDTEFAGAGPRVGIEASHTLGHTAFSAYISANAALLIGDFRERTNTTVPGIFQTAVSDTEDNSYRIIPNFEMTVGLRWQPTCHTTFEAGWMFEEFGNMASSNSTSCTNCSGMTAAGVGSDVSFDGLTVRMEHCF